MPCGIKIFNSRSRRATKVPPAKRCEKTPLQPFTENFSFFSDKVTLEGRGIERDVKIASGHGFLPYITYSKKSERFFRVQFSTLGKIGRSREIPLPRGEPSQERKIYLPNFLYHSTTAVKRMRLTILNARQTRSGERSPSGAISKKHIHIPRAQGTLISAEDFLLTTLTMRGMSHKGSIIAAINAIVFVILPLKPIFLRGTRLCIRCNIRRRTKARVTRRL